MIRNGKKMGLTLAVLLFCITGAFPLAAGVDQSLSSLFAVEFTENSTDLEAVLEFCRRLDRLVQKCCRGDTAKDAIPVRLMLMQELNGGRWRWESFNSEGRLCFGADFRNWKNDAQKRDLLLAVLLQCRLGLNPAVHYQNFPGWIATTLNAYFDRQQEYHGPMFFPHYGYLRTLALAGAAVRLRPEWLEPPPEPGFAAEKAVYGEYQLLTLDLAFRLSKPGKSVLAEWIRRSAAKEPQEKIFAVLLTEPVTAAMVQERARSGLAAAADDAEKSDLAMRRITWRMLFHPRDPLPAERLRQEVAKQLVIPARLTETGEAQGTETANLEELPHLAERNSRYARLARERIPELRELAAVASPKVGSALEKLIRLLGTVGRGRASRTGDQLRETVNEIRTELDRQQQIEQYLERCETDRWTPQERSRQLLSLTDRRRDPLPPLMQRAFDQAEKSYLGE